MDFQSINQEIKASALEDTNAFLRKFLDHESKIVTELSNYSGLQSELYLSHRPNELQALKFSSIFSDFTSVYVGTSIKQNYHFTYFTEPSPYQYDIKLTIPGTLASEFGDQFTRLPGYLHHHSNELKQEATQVSPLIDANKILLRPIRSVWVDNRNESEKEKWTVYYAQGNTDIKSWTIRDSFERESLPVSDDLTIPQSETLMELLVPYFKDTSFTTLSEILHDETDTLSSLRAELKKVIRDYDPTSTYLKEIQQDVIRPQLDTLNRHFKHYQNTHRLKVIGSVGLFSLSLVKVFGTQSEIQEVINSLIGGSGITYWLTSEMEYQKNINSLRDNPYFLLWRISRHKGKL